MNFCQVINPKYETAWFHEVIAESLERALQNTLNKKPTRIILSIPPRHGKSQLASIYFPAWALGLHPDLKIILATYGSELSEDMGMKTRDVVNGEAYQAIFNTKLKPDTKAKAKWLTDKEGGYTAVGVGGAITGKGGNVLILDDLHKDRAEAESVASSNAVWDYYRSTLYSRQEGHAAIIVIMQRWNQRDLVARLLEEDEKQRESGGTPENWEVITLPAIADSIEPHREPGDALWPSKYPVEFLNKQKQQSSYFWASQYMQNPILQEAAEFKESYFRYHVPSETQKKFLRYYTLVDPAISQKQNADNTVVLTVAKEVNGPNIYRIREDAGHFTPQQTIELIFKHTSEHGSNLWLETVAYQQALKFLIEEQQRKRQVYFVINETKSGNKETRIRGLLGLYQQGVIHHLASDKDYELEALHFPHGKHDDRIDCMSFLLQALDNTKTRRFATQVKKKFNGYFRS